ncbi:hypothetical protein B0H13DRAFT_2568557 [Mycena leptocephala]|nr:hypothetical protein B0H13DRAFT_2568557 [Mycena leptocephala]
MLTSLTSFPSFTPPHAAAHQERGTVGEHNPPPETQSGRSSLPPTSHKYELQAQRRTRLHRRRYLRARGGEMMIHRNWAVQRCLDSAKGPEEHCKIVACMRSRIVDLATNCYGYYVLQKVLDCEEVLLADCVGAASGDRATTLVNKHVSHLWSKVRVVLILSNLYPSSSAPTFALVLSFDPLCFRLDSSSTNILTLHFHPADRCSFHRPRFVLPLFTLGFYWQRPSKITELSWTPPAPLIFAYVNKSLKDK